MCPSTTATTPPSSLFFRGSEFKSRMGNAAVCGSGTAQFYFINLTFWNPRDKGRDAVPFPLTGEAQAPAASESLSVPASELRSPPRRAPDLLIGAQRIRGCVPAAEERRCGGARGVGDRGGRLHTVFFAKIIPAHRAKHSKSDARGIALRTQEILNVVAEAVPDPSVIPASMLQSIERFTVLLDDIQRRMEAIALTGGVSRVMHLNRNEAALREINKRLDEAYRDFLAASALRLEVQQAELTARQAELAVKQTELALQQVGTHAEIGKVVRMTDTMAPQLSGVLFYSRLNFFLGRP
ncbi:hypothetical protein B0H11DRAFT_1916033 [Mycena galericulata]|nr:hypothetical protein B0H11DRAFT_1916033 [Mycena galericulata]